MQRVTGPSRSKEHNHYRDLFSAIATGEKFTYEVSIESPFISSFDCPSTLTLYDATKNRILKKGGTKNSFLGDPEKTSHDTNSKPDVSGEARSKKNTLDPNSSRRLSKRLDTDVSRRMSKRMESDHLDHSVSSINTKPPMDKTNKLIVGLNPKNPGRYSATITV